MPAQQAGTPLDVVLMVDVSHSVTHPGFFKTDRSLIADAATALATALDPADRARLGVFGTTIALTPTALSGRVAIARAASGFAGVEGGPSPVWDALNASAVALDTAAGRRAVIVVTDGRSTGNRISFAEIVARLEQARLPVFVVALDLKRPPTPDPGVRLRQLAERTGGRYFLAKRDGVAAAIKRAVASLRQ
jgi:Mg-chelatase subunit ChlD